MKAHPIADLFPMLQGEELQALADDIKENGLHDAILVHEGEIIDGRNRWRACEIAGVTPVTEEYGGLRADIPARIISKNLRRRHLTTDQRAAIAAEIANFTHGGDRRSAEPIKAPNGALNKDAPPTVTVASAAKLMNVGERTVERAKARMRTDPEAHKAAIRGDRPKKARKPKPVAGERGPKPKPTKPDLAELVANLNALWSTKDVNCYEPTEQQLSMLKHNGPDVVRKLQSLASRFDYAMSSSGLSLKHERALAAMVKEANGADPVPAPEPEAPAPANGADATPNDLRDRTRAVLTKLDMSESRFAKHAGIPQPTLNRFKLGKGKTSKANLTKIEAALAELAEYAGEAAA